MKFQRDPQSENTMLLVLILELILAINEMKVNKAEGNSFRFIDNIRTEQIKQFGTITLQWILKLMNNCVQNMKLPKMWRKAHVVALLKPGKEPHDVKSYRPFSLCFFPR
uniref:Reverse transcriptase n=1 Tax=Cacopsylla melanoneura TaxID=428564 RepID=A0A8D8W4F4_9HEMI